MDLQFLTGAPARPAASGGAASPEATAEGDPAPGAVNAVSGASADGGDGPDFAGILTRLIRAAAKADPGTDAAPAEIRPAPRGHPVGSGPAADLAGAPVPAGFLRGQPAADAVVPPAEEPAPARVASKIVELLESLDPDLADILVPLVEGDGAALPLAAESDPESTDPEVREAMVALGAALDAALAPITGSRASGSPERIVENLLAAVAALPAGTAKALTGPLGEIAALAPPAGPAAGPEAQPRDLRAALSVLTGRPPVPSEPATAAAPPAAAPAPPQTATIVASAPAPAPAPRTEVSTGPAGGVRPVALPDPAKVRIVPEAPAVSRPDTAPQAPTRAWLAPLAQVDWAGQAAPGPAPAVPTISAAAPAAAPAEIATVQRIAGQVVPAIVANPERGRVEVRLEPPSLGRLEIAIDLTDGHLRVVVQADKPSTLDLLRRHGEMLTLQLQENGFGDVDVSFSSDRGASRAEPGRHEAAPEESAAGGADAPGRPAARAAPAEGGLDLRL